MQGEHTTRKSGRTHNQWQGGIACFVSLEVGQLALTMALKDFLTPPVGFACMILATLFSMYSTGLPPSAVPALECPSGTGQGLAKLPRGPHGSFSIATYNTEWLFDGINDEKSPFIDVTSAQVCSRYF